MSLNKAAFSMCIYNRVDKYFQKLAKLHVFDFEMVGFSGML